MLRTRAGVPGMIRSDDPLVYFRRRHLRDEVELAIGRSAVRVILALITLALGAALALSGSAHARDLADVLRWLPTF
jgi:hypothetical protein